MQKQLEAVSKLLLWNSQQVRALKAVVISCYRLESKSLYIIRGQEEVAQFLKHQESLRQSGKEQEEIINKLGEIHVWAFNGLVKALLEEEEKNVPAATKKMIQENVKKWGKDSIPREI
eukprot:8399345-Karenia_brevis.AAC.1